jgi:hypothetical protein
MFYVRKLPYILAVTTNNGIKIDVFVRQIIKKWLTSCPNGAKMGNIIKKSF